MWLQKKWLVAIVLTLVLILAIGIVGGVVYAETNNSTTNSTTTPADPQDALMAKVATILGIDQQKLENAFTQAQEEIQDEAMTARLNSLVKDGTITQEQADQYMQWWQSKPSIPALDIKGRPGFSGGFGGMPGPRGSHSTLPTTTPPTTSETN